MPVQLQAIYGRKIETGKEFLDIPKTWKTMTDLEDYLCYHITGIDKAGNLVVHYSGSAAARKGSGGKGRSSVSFFLLFLVAWLFDHKAVFFDSYLQRGGI